MSFNAKFVPHDLEVGDLVMRWADIGEKNASQGKLDLNWEGPYWVIAKTGRGAYILETLEKKPIPRTWNGTKLERYYC